VIELCLGSSGWDKLELFLVLEPQVVDDGALSTAHGATDDQWLEHRLTVVEEVRVMHHAFVLLKILQRLCIRRTFGWRLIFLELL
jgi:hypothetical protein